MCATRVITFPRLWKKAHDNPTEFESWTALLDLVQKQQNIENARKAFESFFQHFPYCYGYWMKWAEMEKYKGNKEKSLEVYRAGIKAIPLSIKLWTAYLEAATEFYHGHEDYETKMRSLYEEAIDTAGLQFCSNALWEHYISWETGHNRLNLVMDLYTRLLQVPTQQYLQTWDSLNKLIEENNPEDLLSSSEFARLHAQVSLNAVKEDMEPPILGSKKALTEVTDAVRKSIRELLVASREQIYRLTYSEIAKRWYFEEKIRRPYFHVQPLEEAQVNNWSEYLSFEEAETAAVCQAVRDEIKAAKPEATEEQLDAAVASSDVVKLAKRRVLILYERCLVACALYENFWIRYARYLELTERNISAAREVWRRACTIHLRYKPTIHWHWGCFEDRYPSDLDQPPTYPVKTCLEILTELEERLTDSPLVCCRRADAMRRAKKPLFDIIACLRAGINRLRYLAEDQTKLAKSLSGPTASRTVAQAIATSSQARAGAGVLAGRLARLLHRGDLVPEGVPLWMLLLDTVEEETEDQAEDPSLADAEDATVTTKQEEEEDAVEEVVMEDAMDEVTEEKADPDKSANEKTDQQSSSGESMQDSDDMATESDKEENNNEEAAAADMAMDDGGSPPTIVSDAGVKRKFTDTTDEQDRRTKKPKKEKHEEEEAEEKEVDELELAKKAEEERIRKEKELAAEEEERIRSLLNRRKPLVHLSAPAEETLTAEDHVVLTGEEAAIRVLKEAIEYDPRNERLYAQLLDIVYQRRPVDIEGFIEAADFACIESVLPAAVKLAFSQRKLQFLEEFDTDTVRLSSAYEEYLNLCDAVNTTVVAAAAARGGGRFTTAYPLPDLLNLPSASARVTSVAAAGSGGDSLVTAGPVVRQPLLQSDKSVLDAAASVGTPAPDPSTSAGYFTAGGYEPLAAALGSTGGLPAPVPTNIPVLGMTDGATWATDPYASYYYGATAAVPTSVATSSSA